LRATKFVASIIKHGLRHYIEGSNASYTILAPRDDYLDESLSLRYHIIEGKYLPSDLKDEMLVKTELKTEELRNNKQRATVKLVQKWDTNDDESVQRTEIQFNGIGVVGEAVEIGNDVIYLLSSTMTPPQPIIKVLNNDKQLASMSTYIIINNIIQQVRSAKGITMIAPSSEAFLQLGLVNAYFLLHEAKADLNSVLLHHIINETIYSEDITKDEKTYYTMGGDPIKVYKKDNDIFFSNANGTSIVGRKDVLTSTGVLHVLDKVILPPTLHITLGKLLKGINAQTFLDVVKAANLTDLVQDPLEPYTILAPTEGAFKRINVTKLLADPELASRWARLHIIPKKLDELKNGDELPTLLSNDAILVIKKAIGGSYYSIEVKGYWSFKENAKLLSGGRTWNGGAVYEIDKVLLPEHVQQIGRTFSDIIMGFVLFGFLAMSCIYSWHFWQIWKREIQGYQEIDRNT
jgi:solute carrier family 25 carnitine/acylcarnitine transporter 20/29